MGIYEELQARGLVKQVTNEPEIREMVNAGKAKFYIGFDCTADSLTAGHFMALTLMKRLQMAGNQPVALIGGGAYYGIGHPTGAGSKAESVQANDSKESGSDASAKDGSKSKEKSHIHDWSITYKTVHHDAVTHTEHVAPVYQNLTTYHTVCNECKQVIDGKADDHIKQTGHSGYSTNVPITDEVMVSEGYDKQVTDTPAYDETVIDKLVCTTCGATKDAPQATSDAAK